MDAFNKLGLLNVNPKELPSTWRDLISSLVGKGDLKESITLDLSRKGVDKEVIVSW